MPNQRQSLGRLRHVVGLHSCALDTRRIDGVNGVAGKQAPFNGLPKRLFQDPVLVVNAGRRKAALAVPTAADECSGVSLGYLHGLQPRQNDIAERWRDVLGNQLGVALMCTRTDLWSHVSKPPVEKLCQRNPGWF